MATAGATAILLPDPIEVPPQVPLYHFHEAPWPSVPPLTVNVVLVPRQMVDVPVIDDAGNELSLTVTFTVLHMVVLQVPSALT